MFLNINVIVRIEQQEEFEELESMFSGYAGAYLEDRYDKLYWFDSFNLTNNYSIVLPFMKVVMKREVCMSRDLVLLCL